MAPRRAPPAGILGGEHDRRGTVAPPGRQSRPRGTEKGTRKVKRALRGAPRSGGRRSERPARRDRALATAPSRRFAREAARREEAAGAPAESTGSSAVGSDDAVQQAIARAAKTLHNLRWFEVTDTRGHIEDGSLSHWQVTLKVGFTLEDSAKEL
ncbi:MAG: dodecin domain-containing protein [Myxococcales bacterium]|nr:dodecin domain-containing protein [Myxococcales bacterium]